MGGTGADMAQTVKSFEAVVIRYKHDAATEEFVNIALVAREQAGGQAQVRVIHDWSRVSQFFPDVDTHTLDTLRGALKDLARSPTSGPLVEWLRGSFPVSDSGIDVSQVASGVTSDLITATEKLFQRLVKRYHSSSYMLPSSLVFPIESFVQQSSDIRLAKVGPSWTAGVPMATTQRTLR